MVLKLTGTHPGGAYQVHCPTNKKIYVVWNGTGGDVTFKTVAGTGIPVGAGAVLILYCDGSTSSSWRVWSPRSTTSAMW
jgi:hypothetical protein